MKHMLRRTLSLQFSMVVLVMVWGCFASSGTGNLLLVEGKIH